MVMTRYYTYMEQNYFKRGKRTFGGRGEKKYTKYIKINNNSENFRRGGGKIALAPSVADPKMLLLNFSYNTDYRLYADYRQHKPGSTITNV